MACELHTAPWNFIRLFIFPALVLRLISCSPRRRIRLVTVAGGLKAQSNPVEPDFASASLTPATGARTTRLHRTQKAPIILHAADRSRGSSRPAIAVARLTLSRPPHPAPRS